MKWWAHPSDLHTRGDQFLMADVGSVINKTTATVRTSAGFRFVASGLDQE
ncbi:hypothetical protein GFS60_07801 (plasmid) [Rhodococcus sp. WAY2]|nr:hypothetical protein GFS60_07801 [Rhodococcus sp. WAY2]